MTWELVRAMGLVTAFGLAAVADDPKPDPTQPMYERLLRGDDAMRAADLQKKIAAEEEADRYDEVIKFSEELLGRRPRVQGPIIGNRWPRSGS